MSKEKEFRFRTFIALKVQSFRNFCYRLRGYDVHSTVVFERKLHLDRLYPKGIHIGANTLIASGSTILSHDHCKRVGNICLLTDTYIGKNCFIAVNSTILPGVKIGDSVIIGAGAVVTKDVPSNCIVAGNPAKIIRENIKVDIRGELLNWNIADGWVE